MGVIFTEDQQRVIDARNKNILVSAAAGSGKTAVLVERIIQKITDKENPADIDRLLVVTFTNAAAAGMKERISNAIQTRLMQEPENIHLQRQAVLVHQAQITTIHSFCLYLIRNHFEAIGLEPDFTVADEAVIQLLSAEVREKVLEEAFAEQSQEFVDMVEFICHNGRESNLEDYIDQLYKRAMSMPFPKRWLSERKNDYDFADLDTFVQTDSGKYLFKYIKSLTKSYMEAYERLYKVAVEADGPYMYADILESEKEFLEKINRQTSLEAIGTLLPNMEFGRLSSKKDESVHAGKREWVKTKRNAYKKQLQELAGQFFGKSPQSIQVENEACKKVIGALVDITITYMEALAAQKRKRGLIDFHDMEHMALEILLRETDTAFEPTEIAVSYQEFFDEVMVDEYQDSNMVQEFLVHAVSGLSMGKHNRFMVGDVKQSIYKFRLARPELFMEKYYSYGACDAENIRIDLKQNFRSRNEVLLAVNSVFEKVMLFELGGIAYDENAALYPAAAYPNASDMQAELIIAADNRPQAYDAKMWEAYCVAKRIKDLLKYGQVTDDETKKLRRVTYADIVLLFRSPASFEDAYRKVFEQQGIPMYMASTGGYFDSAEIQNLIKFLHAVENPRLDIPLFGVCISVFGGLSEDQLARVKVHYREALKAGSIQPEDTQQSLYDMLCLYHADFDDETAKAIGHLLDTLQKYRRKMSYMTVSELLYDIIREFSYREYVAVLPDGEKRLANVALLLERAETFGAGGNRSVFAFISYINQLRKQSADYGEAGLIEQSDVVRVMSIHKSKGLEFPITIVCGMGQNYQMRDKQQMLLIDNDMGLGVDYVNTTLRSKNKTLRKNVIALKMEQEILAEEQRILYVAMTRAKEKLIMAGYKQGFTDEQSVQEGYGTAYEQSDTCMLTDVLAARSYLDLCLLARKTKSPIALRVMTADDYMEAEIVESVTREGRKELLVTEMAKELADTEDSCLSEQYNAYTERFTFAYPYAYLKDLYVKTTVSELKKAAMQEEGEASLELFGDWKQNKQEAYVPAFMRENTVLQGAERGTAYHKVMELLDFAQPPTDYKQWKETLALMTVSKKLSVKQAECIYIPTMQKFIASEIGQRMVSAACKGKLFKERSFFLGVSANTIEQNLPAEEMMLVQGMIDCYFEEDGQLVLVDYKTDRISYMEQLTQRYTIQMKYYKQALEQALGLPVKEAVLYSLYLGESTIVIV